MESGLHLSHPQHLVFKTQRESPWLFAALVCAWIEMGPGTFGLWWTSFADSGNQQPLLGWFKLFKCGSKQGTQMILINGNGTKTCGPLVV